MRKLATAADLARALALARRQWAPFLRNLAPAPTTSRVVVPIGEADWRLEPNEAWQRVRLPHYGGPIGRARAWYRMGVMVTPALRAVGGLFLHFRGVDYRAAVFCNGHLVGTHEGFFAAFDCDITAAAREGVNEILVRVDNDAVCMGNGSAGRPEQEGDKIYAATGLGWDEPGLGWHHCPPGMGLCQPVTLEARPLVHLHDLWVRPVPGEGRIEIHAEVWNATAERQPVRLRYAVHARNFSAGRTRLPRGEFGELAPAGPGLNYYRVSVPFAAARRWSPDAPWLYQATVDLAPPGEATPGCGPDAVARSFGQRSFRMDTETVPRGRLFLNDRSIRLRGANTMGHEQQCVFYGDHRQLLDDLLLVKLGHLNFLRFTQRPVEREVYELCDSLGILAQTDLPLFAYLRRNQFAEAVRQAVEMERHVRAHPCAVVSSFINEPFPEAWGDKFHRHLRRDELEAFLRAASEATWVENPDRVIKPIDGDYSPPGPGLPDCHLYSGWYNGHGIELGRLHAGAFPPVKPDWLYACGEYGSEGLEDAGLMRRRYPAAWLPRPGEPEAAWTPARIAHAQTGTHHAMFFDPQATMADWVSVSQRHQAWVTRIMTTAMRRDARLVSCALHLYIDAFPAGWMKTVIDCERRPKAAFFAFRDALTPLLADLKLSRWAWFAGELIDAEAWVCNDTPDAHPGARLHYQLELAGRVVFARSAPARVQPDEPVRQGRIRLRAPAVSRRTPATLRLAVVDRAGRRLHDTEQALEIFPAPVAMPRRARATRLGSRGGAAERFVAGLDLPRGRDLIVIDDPAAFARERDRVLADVAAGATALFLDLPPGELDLPGGTLRFATAGMAPRIFVSRRTGHPLVEGFEPNDFRWWEDAARARPAPILETLFFAPDSAEWRPVLKTIQFGWGQPVEPALACAERALGRGRLIVNQVLLADRLGNPVARQFAERLAAAGPR